MKKTEKWKKASILFRIPIIRSILIIKDYIGVDDFLGLFFLALGLSYFFIDYSNYPSLTLLIIFQDMHAEIIGIGLTVLILGNADEYIRNKVEKRTLISQMGSPDNSFTREAIRQLRDRNWLYDGTLTNADLSRANLQETYFYQAYLKNANFTHANLKNTQFEFSYLRGANFGYSNMKEADLSFTNLRKATFYIARLNHASFESANLEGADLSHAQIREADFHCACLKEANLEWADLRNSYLSTTNFQGASLRNANMEGAELTSYGAVPRGLCGRYRMGGPDDPDLVGANLEQAVLINANLINVDLTGVSYDENTVWTDAKYSKSTIWPEGFDPVAAGCVLVDDPE